jgi:hypothetical protein
MPYEITGGQSYDIDRFGMIVSTKEDEPDLGSHGP